MKNFSFLSLFILSVAFLACGNNNSASTTETKAKETNTSPTTAMEAKEEPAKKIVATSVGELSEKELVPTKEKPKAAEKATNPTTSAEKSPVKVNTKVIPEEKTKTTKTAPVVEKKEEKVVEPKAETPANTPNKRTTAKIKDEIKKLETAKETPKEAKDDKGTNKAPAKPAFSHDAWDKLLRSNVSSSGKVNYKAFKAQKAALEQYLKALADNPIQSSWSRNKKMAYWINAYNAFTIKLIVDNYPVASITDLHGGKPWDKKWIKLGTKTYSLNNIENDILRPQYKDARIHFAVNCAAKSCPPILNRAWTASNLNANFEKQAKAFINNNGFNSISADAVEISKIFEWYAVDFGNIVDYLNKYAKTKINSSAKVSYKDYNWKLNE